MGNGPTEDEAGIMDHDQLSQHSEEGDEVSSSKNITKIQNPLSKPSFLFKKIRKILSKIFVCFHYGVWTFDLI